MQMHSIIHHDEEEYFLQHYNICVENIANDPSFSLEKYTFPTDYTS